MAKDSHQLSRAYSPSLIALIAAFGAVYLIWGSTYLAIRYAIETIPPFLMAGVRFVVAGGLICGWSRLRGGPPLGRRHWLSGVLVGGFLFLGGNGGVVWSEQFVPSGVAAVIVATLPLWMVLLQGFFRGHRRPTLLEIGGVLIGLVGVLILVDPFSMVAGQRLHLGGCLVLTGASFSWAIGSLYAQQVSLPASPFLAAGVEMLCGGMLLLLAGGIGGEWSRFNLDAVSSRSLVAFIYLVVLGSIVAFTAFMWLLRVTTPARVATYAYVNPIVAVLLGWVLGGEVLSGRMFVATGVILGAVVLINVYGRRIVVGE